MQPYVDVCVFTKKQHANSLVEPPNTEQLVHAVLRLQQSPEVCLRLARSGQALTEMVRWERIVAQHEARYATIR